MPYIDKHEIEQLSIVDFLARLNFTHKFKSGPEYFYYSPLRRDDRTPSFSVNDAKGLWMDRGNADPDKRGGGIIRLAEHFWPALSFHEVLREIQSVFDGAGYALPVSYTPHTREHARPDDQQYQFELWDVRPVGHYQPITDYLESRGLMEVAEGRLSEVYYRDIKQPYRKLPLFGIGWQNVYGNYEFRNLTGFKSTIGRKGISVIPGDPARVQVFEGYLDYLSQLRYFTETDIPPTVIVLNAVNMLKFALSDLTAFAEVDLYLDNDSSGYACAGKLLEHIPWAVDRSGEYEGYKDYNAKLMADLGLDTDQPRYQANRIGR